MPWTKLLADSVKWDYDIPIIGKERLTSYRDAIQETLCHALKLDPRVFIMGEGVDDPTGVFGTTLNLHKDYGCDKVFDLPIAENGFTGIAIGASLTGMRPIVVHMRMDFLLVSMDQIANHAAKWHYMFGGKQKVPIVIRCIIGRGWGSAAQHSQSLQGLFMHIPGLKIVMPSNAYDAKGLLFASIADNNPVLFIEHRWLYDQKHHVPEGIYTIPFGNGVVKKEGKDVTVVAISYMVPESMQAAKKLHEDGIDVEIIDPRTLKPLDIELILKSVKKTGRLVIADMGWKTCGVAAEISALINENAFEYLKSPILRVTLPDIPTPASPVLEKVFYPTSNHIVDAIRSQFKRNFLITDNLYSEKIGLSVIMPAFNGEKNILSAIKDTLNAFDEFDINGEIIVINDGSTDRTEKLVEDIMKKYKCISMIRHETRHGTGVSFWDGFDRARGDAIVTLSANNENDPWEITRYFKLLEHVDVVIPFIFNREARPVFRNVLSLIYRFIINTTFLVNFNYTNGNVLYRKSILKELENRSTGYFYQTYILIKAAKKGYLFAEVPYRVGMRREAEYNVVSFPAFLQVVRGYFRLIMDYYFQRKRDISANFGEDSLTKIRRQDQDIV